MLIAPHCIRCLLLLRVTAFEKIQAWEHRGNLTSGNALSWLGVNHEETMYIKTTRLGLSISVE